MLELPPCQNLSLLDSRGPHPMTTPVLELPCSLSSNFTLHLHRVRQALALFYPSLFSASSPPSSRPDSPDQTLHNRLSITSLHRLQLLGPVLLLSSSRKSPVFQNACSPGLQRWLEKIHSWEGLPFQRHSFNSQMNSQVCSDTLLPAQISSLSLVTIVMCPTLSLNSLPNSIFTLSMCFASYFTKKIGVRALAASQMSPCLYQPFLL